MPTLKQGLSKEAARQWRCKDWDLPSSGNQIWAIKYKKCEEKEKK